AAKERLAKLETEAKAVADREAEDRDVRAAVDQLQSFAARVRNGLENADWDTRREILRALIRKVAVGDDAIRIEYKVGPLPFEQRPDRGVSQDCGRADLAPAGEHRAQPSGLETPRRRISLRAIRRRFRGALPEPSAGARGPESRQAGAGK